MRALVTGAAGFIGGAVARALAAGEDVTEVIALDRLPAAAAPRIVPRLGDLADIAALEPLALDLVVHCAGITTSACEADPEAAYAINVEGTRALLAWCASLPHPPRLVLTSTIAVFGGGEVLVDEASRVEPSSTYGATKAMAEMLVLDAARRGEVDGVVVRLPVTIVRPSRVGRPGAGYLSDLVIHVAGDRPFTAPLAPDRVVPVASLATTLAVLLAAADRDAPRLLHVPAVPATGAAVLRLLTAHGLSTEHVSFVPDPAVERLIQGWPERFDSRYGIVTPAPLAAIVADAVRAGDGVTAPPSAPARGRAP